MISSFNVTAIGYSHINSKMPCQDFSASYSDRERTIITACDGHGGKVYIRSQRGSKFASEAILRAMLDIESLSFRKYTPEEIEHKLKLDILCEWNELVKRDLKKHPIRKGELKALNEVQIEALRQNPTRAYGTTLGGAMLYGGRLICVGLGDGGCYLLKNGDIKSAFEEDEDEPVANFTYSMCGEDAFEHMRASIFDFRSFDGIMLCTDGVLAPYASLENLKKSFVRPTVKLVLENKIKNIKGFIYDLGAKSGVGDDVSLAMILKDNMSQKYYR